MWGNLISRICLIASVYKYAWRVIMQVTAELSKQPFSISLYPTYSTQFRITTIGRCTLQINTEARTLTVSTTISKMSGFNCHVLALPEDTLLSLFESWLDLKDVVRLDSAICDRSLRPSYLEMLGKCPLSSKYGGYFVDDYIRWRASRHLKRLDTLVVVKVSDSYIENSAHAANVLTEVKTLFVDNPKGTKVTRWLELVAPMFQNLSEFHSSGLRFADIGWILLFGRNEHLERLRIHYEYKDYLLPDSLLYHFRNCRKLKTLELSNYCYNGIESILANNANLIKVSLDRCKFMTDATFALTLYLPCVQHIELSRSEYIVGDGALNNITTTSLRLLSLSYFLELTEDNLLRILAALPNKPILDVRLVYMERITAAFADRCEHLCLNNVHISMF